MESVELPDARLTVDGRPVPCISRLAYGGAYQLTIWTILPAFALELHSTYLGHPDGDTAVSHLQLRPLEQPLTVTDRRPGASLPVREGRRFCLYDHLAALRDLVADYTSESVNIEIADRALDRVDVS